MTLCEFIAWYQQRYRRTSSSLMTMAMIVADLVGVMFSFSVGFFLVNVYDMGLINFKSFVTYWPYMPVFIFFFLAQALYPGIALAPAEELRRFFLASFLAHGVIILSRYVEDLEFDAVSIAFIISFAFSTLIFLLFRSSMRSVLSKTRLGRIPAVVYGSGSLARRLVDKLDNGRWVGYVPVVLLSDASCRSEPGKNEPPAFYRGVPIVRDVNIGPEIARQLNIKMAFIAMPHLEHDELTSLINFSVSAFRYSVLIPGFAGLTSIWMSVLDFNGLLGFATGHRLKMGWNLAVKRLLDIVLVLTGGLAILPVLLLIAVLVKITSRGPVLYTHERVGRNGVPFRVYKFRSMAINAERGLQKVLDSNPRFRAEWEANHKLKNDPRVTFFGKFLRRTSLDEFPQLINVLKGDMSLVGPRPITNAEKEKYGEDFARIFSVRPGITGLWQVSGRSDTDYADRISLDSYYLQSWSIWLDLWVLYKTFGAVINRSGAY